MPATAAAERGRAAVAPSEAMRLLLVAGSADAAPAAAAWADWLELVDIEHLEDGATALLSLVSRNLAELAADPSIEGRVRGVHRQTWARNRMLWAAGAPLIDRLGAVAGLPLLLPATALLPIYDDDWGARPLERIEVALDPGSADVARAALGDLGWEVEHVTPALLARTRARREERWQSQDRSGNWVTIRWRVLRRIPSVVADEQLRGAAVVTTVGASRVHLLHPADALLERLWTSTSERSPGWIADAVQLARRAAAEVEGDGALVRFAVRAQRFGILPAVHERLALVASVVPDPAVLAALDALGRVRPGLAPTLWSLPEPATRLGQAWAGHAAGQGMVRGARSLVRARWTVRQLRATGTAGSAGSAGSAQRR